MWAWQVTMWAHQGIMHVQYSNTLINTLRITDTNILSCYRQEWSKARRPFWKARPVSLVLVTAVDLVVGTRVLECTAVHPGIRIRARTSYHLYCVTVRIHSCSIPKGSRTDTIASELSELNRLKWWTTPHFPHQCLQHTWPLDTKMRM